MGEEFYAALKLITGEEIFALVSVDENDGDSIIMLSNPVIMKMLSSPAGKYVKVKPWLELPCLLYTSPSPRDRNVSRMPSSA